MNRPGRRAKAAAAIVSGEPVIRPDDPRARTVGRGQDLAGAEEPAVRPDDRRPGRIGPPAVAPGPARPGGGTAAGEIVVELRGVGLTYPGPPKVTAVRDCDLALRAGEYAAITGASGSGKSSLLNVLGLLDEPTAGSYRLNGLDVARLSDTERTAVRARDIGFVFQAFHLLEYRTAAENVALGLLYSQAPRRERAAKARQALDRVGLSHRADAVPAKLSGGERQRVAIARALSGEPTLLLCDEPTGNLDSATTDTVLDLLGELHAGGVAIVMITHEQSVAARADRVLVMRDGRLSEPAPAAGPPSPDRHRSITPPSPAAPAAVPPPPVLADRDGGPPSPHRHPSATPPPAAPPPPVLAGRLSEPAPAAGPPPRYRRRSITPPSPPAPAAGPPPPVLAGRDTGGA